MNFRISYYKKIKVAFKMLYCLNFSEFTTFSYLIFLYLEILNEIMLFIKTYNIDTNNKHNINQTK